LDKTCRDIENNQPKAEADAFTEPWIILDVMKKRINNSVFYYALLQRYYEHHDLHSVANEINLV